MIAIIKIIIIVIIIVIIIIIIILIIIITLIVYHYCGQPKIYVTAKTAKIPLNKMQKRSNKTSE